MPAPGNTRPIPYPDVIFFLLFIPCISALNYYLTYTHIRLSWHTALTYTLDTVEGYAAWWALRSIIIWLDRKLPYEGQPLRRIVIQFILTTIAGQAVIILSTELTNWIAKDTPVVISFYTFDVFIFLIWFFVLNAIYVGWYYYYRLHQSEQLRAAEKKMRQEGITVKQGKQHLQVAFADIAGVYVEGEYAVLVTTQRKKYLLDQSLDKVEKLLPPELFFRLNRQYILHRHMITGFERAENSKINVLVLPSDHLPPSIPVSRTKAPVFKAWLQPED